MNTPTRPRGAIPPLLVTILTALIVAIAFSGGYAIANPGEAQEATSSSPDTMPDRHHRGSHRALDIL